MHKIIRKKELNPTIILMQVEAPHIVRNAKPGQFIVIHTDETAERIPLTICDKDDTKKTITIIFQKLGTSTNRLGLLSEGDSVKDILGPLGHPTPIKNYGKAICIGGGVGVAEIYPVAKALKEAGNEVVSIIGSRSKDLLILEEELKSASSKVLVATDDGSHGHKGFVTDLLEKELSAGGCSMVFCVGPVLMMKKSCDTAKGFNTPIRVSLGSNMVDATGMCGTCRVNVGGKTYFACVDGPEFDGTLVDYDELLSRDKRFVSEEKLSFEAFKKGHKCKCGNRTRKTE
ncbi:MAG: sulfide/dihydroorotate dehydrogenase-like FAD/NAD-binding protein [Candidatus Omnitrophota bacterium]